MPTAAKTPPGAAPAAKRDRVKVSRPSAAVVANVGAGSVVASEAARLRATLEHHDGPRIVSFRPVAPDRIFQAAKKALVASPDVLVVVGGDGTARTVAEAAAPSGTPIAPLPFGTMNILARRLYGDLSAPEIMLALRHGRVEKIPAGRVNGRLFLLSAALGFPVSLAKMREDARRGDLAHLADAANDAAQALSDFSEPRIVYRGDDNTPRCAAGLALTIGPVEDLFEVGPAWREAASFDVVAAKTGGLIDIVRLGSRALSDTWREDESVEILRSRLITADMSGEVLVGLDGDPIAFETPLEFSFEAASTPVLVPESSP